MNSNLEEEIKQAISKVNESLSMWDKEYIKQQRAPYLDEEFCENFEEFVERRLNYECSQIPAFKKIMEETEGHLFFCTKLEEKDLLRKKFKKAFIKLLTPMMIEDEFVTEELKAELQEIASSIGGTEFSFNNVKKKIKIVVNDK